MAQKVYDRINFVNGESGGTPLNGTSDTDFTKGNLNKMDFAINEIDNRVVTMMNSDENAESHAIDSENSANDSQESALKSEGYAIGKQDGVDVSSGEYYQNNAKYYSEKAEEFKNQAESFTPSGYSDLVDKVDEVSDTIDTLYDDYLGYYEWDSTRTYYKGDIVTYKGARWSCASTNKGSEPDNSEYWGVTTLRNDIENLKSTVAKGDRYYASTDFSVGDMFVYNGKIYRVKVACSGQTPPNSTYYDEYTLTSELSALNNSLTQLINISDIQSQAVSVTTSSTGGGYYGVVSSFQVGKIIIPLGVSKGDNDTINTSFCQLPDGRLYVRATVSGNYYFYYRVVTISTP